MERNRNNRHRWKRRFPFTLVELFVAISILTLLGSLVLVRTRPMLDHYRFARAISRLKQEIGLTRRLSRNANADIEFHIDRRGETLLCLRKTDEPLPFSHILNVPFSIPYLKMKEERVVLTFTASGWIGKEVDFTLSFKDKSERLTFSNREIDPSKLPHLLPS